MHTEHRNAINVSTLIVCLVAAVFCSAAVAQSDTGTAAGVDTASPAAAVVAPVDSSVSATSDTSGQQSAAIQSATDSTATATAQAPADTVAKQVPAADTAAPVTSKRNDRRAAIVFSALLAALFVVIGVRLF